MNFFNNVKWVSLSQFIKVICQLAGLVIFARYLTPQEIGVMSLTIVVVNFINILRDMGSSAAIIQKDVIDDGLKNSVFILNVVMGLVLAFIFYLLAYSISLFFRQEELEYTIKLITLAFIFNGFSSVHLALLERASKFKIIAAIEVTASIFSLLLGVYFATNNYGVYSLVFQTLSFSFLTAVSFYIFSGWKPTFTFDFKYIKSIFKFSSNLVLFNFINYFSRNSDQLIIGKYFSASVLGEYSLAYRVMLFPIQNITSVLTRSLYPILSRLQSSPSEAFSIYLKTIKTISLIVPPLMLGLAAVSTEFVHFVFGDQWSLLSKLLTWLAIVGIFQAIVSSTGAVFMSTGRTDILLYISVFNGVLQVGAFIIGAFYQIETLVKIYLLANVIMFFPNVMLAVRTLRGDIFSFLACVYKPLICAVLMFFIVKNVGFIFNDLSPLLFLLIKIFLGVISYTLMIIIVEPTLLKKKYT